MIWEPISTSMYTHIMKTTVEIAPALLKRAKSLARKEGTTLRALLEEGLREVIHSRAVRPRFTLRDAAVKGKGLQDGVREGDWETVRDLTYEGRGS